MITGEFDSDRSEATLFETGVVHGQLEFPEDDMRGQVREYSVRGLLTPERWATALEYLNSLGISAEQVEIPADENSNDKYVDDPKYLSGRQDFTNFAAVTGFSEQTAGRVWSTLASLFQKKTRPKHYAEIRWYKPEDYDHVPEDLFTVYPEDGKECIGGVDYKYKYDGLRLGAVDKMIAGVEEIVPKAGLTTALHEVFGEGFGPMMYKFIKEFSTVKHEEFKIDTQDLT
jgi:hypothetical protein